jgi:PAS domain S-box-containing protein
MRKEKIKNSKNKSLCWNKIEKYNFFFENAVDAILIADLKTKKIVECNKVAEKLTGYSRNEILSMKASKFHPKDKVKETMAGFMRQIKKRGVVRTEILTKNKKIIPVSVNAKLIKVGKKKYLQGVFRDITDIAQFENALGDREKRFHSIFENANDAIWLMDKSTFIDCNLKAIKMFNCDDKTDMVNHTPMDFSPINQPDGQSSKKKALFYINDALHGHPQRFYWQHKKKDGILFDTEISLNRIILQDKLYIQAIGRDITVRKKAELEREQYFKFFQLSTDIMVIADPLGCFEKVNSTCLKILGYSEKELLQKPFIDFVHPDDKQSTKDEMAHQMKFGSSLRFENRYICKDGTILWLSWQANYDKNEGITYATARDITERKKDEENILRINRAIRMVSGINQALIRFTDQKELLNEACRIAVEIGGYSLAWVGFAEQDKNKTIRPVAYAGSGSSYVKKAKLSWADTLRGRGPSGVSIRTMKSSISHFISTDKRMTPWKKNALKWGYKSSIALPLINNKKVFGMIAIYSSEKDAFRDEEVKILEELANDISFGIVTHGIREDMSKFKKAAQTSGEVIYMTDRSGIITFVNSEFTNLYGYTSLEVVGKVTPRILKSGERTHKEYINLWKDLFAGKIVKDEHVNRSKDGHLFSVDSVTSPIFDEKNNIIGFLAIQRDIAERKKRENELRESTEELKKFKMAVESASDHVILTDNKGIIIYANKDTENFTGYSRDEILGKTATIWGGQMSKEFYQKMWKTISKDRKPFSAELINRRKNGQLYDAEIRISPVVDEKGEIKYFIGVERDITKTKEIDRAKDEFMSMASHQLRTPLSAIKWVLDVLVHDSINFTPKQQEKLNDLVISNERLINLVNDLLDVTKIESGKLIVKKGQVDLVKLINDLVVSLNTIADNKKKDIKIITSQEPKIVCCDPVLINEALENLLSNAIYYSKEDSRDISIYLDERQNDYLISIHNEGIIDDTTLDKIKKFEKFVRGDSSLKIKPEGSGLGLYLAKSIIEASGGKFWCESNIKSGTIFYLTITKDKK